MKDTVYFDQAKLLLRVLPHVLSESCFALKGGTAINFFIRDLPRLSVDIDLVYLPIENRTETISNIGEARPNSEELVLNIKPDSSIHLIEIYPVYGMGIDFSKRITNNDETIQFRVPTQHEKYGPLNRIEVFSYDKNMSDYLQALVTVKPQAYNEMVKTVNGGYGVFGSVVKSEIYK